jgi:eukaryotic-like serine/threonine-protein kinase
MMKSDGNRMLQLRIVAGPHEGEERVFQTYDAVVVGTAADASWRLAKDPGLAPYHVRLEINPPECRFVVLDGRARVRIKGQELALGEVAHGDRLNCGATVLQALVVAQGGGNDLPTLPLSGPYVVPGVPEALGPAESPHRVPWESTATFPRRLGDFDLLAELGHGGMGVVYRAKQRSTGREVAVKVIRPAVQTADEATQLFLREATILSKLHHPRIVEYLSLGLIEGQMFLAMEYLPTLEFSKLLKTQSRAKQIRLACGVICRVLEALQHAHAQDIVHRDVKPANILTFKHDGRLQAKLADFGLAKNYLDAGMTMLSVENNVRGTPGYMAPEQILNCRYAKPPCDIFSAGACLYRYLAGRAPFAGKDASDVMSLVLNGKPEPLATLAPDLPGELAAAVHRSLAREPGDRFSSAEHMRRALLRFTEK